MFAKKLMKVIKNKKTSVVTYINLIVAINSAMYEQCSLSFIISISLTKYYKYVFEVAVSSPLTPMLN